MSLQTLDFTKYYFHVPTAPTTADTSLDNLIIANKEYVDNAIGGGGVGCASLAGDNIFTGNNSFAKYPTCTDTSVPTDSNALVKSSTLSNYVPKLSTVITAGTYNSVSVNSNGLVISGTTSSTANNTASYYYNGLPSTKTLFNTTTGNPPTLIITSTDGFAEFNYWDGITFRILVNCQNNYTDTAGSDSQGVLVFDDTFTVGCLSIFPKAFSPLYNSNYFWLTNGIGNVNTNTDYSPINSSTNSDGGGGDSLTPNGRPLYSSGIIDDHNLGSVLSVNPYLNDSNTAMLEFQFSPLGYTQYTTCNWTVVLELLSTGRFSRNQISTVGFLANL